MFLGNCSGALLTPDDLQQSADIGLLQARYRNADPCLLLLQASVAWAQHNPGCDRLAAAASKIFQHRVLFSTSLTAGLMKTSQGAQRMLCHMPLWGIQPARFIAACRPSEVVPSHRHLKMGLAAVQALWQGKTLEEWFIHTPHMPRTAGTPW